MYIKSSHFWSFSDSGFTTNNLSRIFSTIKLTFPHRNDFTVFLSWFLEFLSRVSLSSEQLFSRIWLVCFVRDIACKKCLKKVDFSVLIFCLFFTPCPKIFGVTYRSWSLWSCVEAVCEPPFSESFFIVYCVTSVWIFCGELAGFCKASFDFLAMTQNLGKRARFSKLVTFVEIFLFFQILCSSWLMY